MRPLWRSIAVAGRVLRPTRIPGCFPTLSGSRFARPFAVSAGPPAPQAASTAAWSGNGDVARTPGVGGRSHVRGPVEPPLLEQCIGELLVTQAAKFGNGELVKSRHQDESISWASFLERARSVATALLRLGYGPGDRFGVWMPNNWEWMVSQFAACLVGVVLVNLNPAYRVGELQHALNLVSCRGILIVPEFRTSNYVGMINDLLPELTVAGGAAEHTFANVPSLRHVVIASPEHSPRASSAEPPAGMLPFRDLCWHGDTDLPRLADVAATLSSHDPINIQFTSGTTGLPKAATLTHHGILNNGFFVGERLNLSSEDRLALPVPLYHCFGTVLGVLAAITHGASIVLPGAGFEPLDTLSAVHEERCTVLHGVPTMFLAMLHHPQFNQFDLGSLRTGIMAGAVCPKAVMTRVIEDMHMRDITIAYGMTETSPVSFQTNIGDALDDCVATVGRVMPHTECKVVDERGEVTPVGVEGELLTKGYLVMQGYYNQPEETGQSIDAEGFMHTGDLAVVDERGFCRISGRLKDMIIRAGENVFPKEVEDVIYTHPAVSDVAVVGVPHETLGEEVAAWVIPAPGAAAVNTAELRAFCKERLAGFKCPSHVFSCAEFPMTVTGKVQKFVLRDMSAERLRKGKGAER